jgi:cellulose synthase/poly-beta-1,6-N-acetylglucosamine synthase-like glycosyltransferase
MFNPEDSLEFVLFAFFAMAFLIQMAIYLGIYTKLAFYKKNQRLFTFKPVTVIVCAKNEEDNLRKNLPIILEQDYHNFEVIVVNDLSTDETRYLLEEFEKKYSNLRTITIKQEGSFPIGKKYPLTLGIKGAKHEIVLLTDADCRPKSNKWLETMVRNFYEDKQIVVGYGAYEKLPGLLNKLIRFDTLSIAINYMSLALIGKPYMGVGRNLSYQKSLFFKNKGFASHFHIPSGDDDLFISRVATKDNITIELEEAGHTVSKVKTTFKSWIRQKKRHLTTAPHYKGETKFLLSLISLSGAVFMLSFFLLLALKFQLYVILAIFLVRIIIQLVIFGRLTKSFGEKDLLILMPFLEIMLLFTYPVFIFSNFMIKQSRWN